MNILRKMTVLGVMCFLFSAVFPADGEPMAVVSGGAAPVIDGCLDDPVWQSAARFTDFVTFKPHFGTEMSEKTEMYVTYDACFLYFAFRCSDSEPEKIRATITKRDNIDNDDYVGVILDMANTSQSAYWFVANPFGVQMDSMLNADGNGDGTFDTVWSSMGRKTPDGYEVELAVPLKSIRFPSGEEIVIGLQGVRTIPRKSEQGLSPEYKPEQGALLGQCHQLKLTGLKPGRTVELLPAVTMAQHSRRQQDSLEHGKTDGDFSLTGKLGLSSSLTLEATYNPDFSQVESDAGQIDVNLRSAVYYSERRSFFLEGLDDFNYASAFEASPLASVVHTRTVVDPLLGLKLTGKIGSRNAVSAVFAIDEYPCQLACEEGDAAEGRNAYVSIVRYKRALSGDNYLGGFLTSREHDGSFNRVLGGDFRLRLGRTSVIEGMGLGSFTDDGTERQDGSLLGLRYCYNTEKWNVDLGVHEISQRFRTDLGYISRTGVTMIPIFIMRSVQLKRGIIQRIEPFYWSYHTYDKPSGLMETVNLFVLRLHLPNQSQLRFEGMLGNEVFQGERFDISFVRFRSSIQLGKQFYTSLNLTRGNKIRYVDEPYAGFGNSASVSLRYQPGARFTTSVSLAYADFYRSVDSEKMFDYTILRCSNEFQFNRFLSLRAIAEYNFFKKNMTTDILAAFTYIPGTVIYLGYGGSYEKTRYEDGEYVPGHRMVEMERGFFFKASYLWRL